MRGIRLYAMFAAVFMAGAFLASPELRVYAANTIGSADIINNSIQSIDIKDGEVKTVDLGGNAVTAAKIKDGEVKVAEIAKDAVGADEIAFDSVGASELQGVDKLIFADCDLPKELVSMPPGGVQSFLCGVPGADAEDEVIVTESGLADCYDIHNVNTQGNGLVAVSFRNDCSSSSTRLATHLSIIVFDELPDKVLP